MTYNFKRLYQSQPVSSIKHELLSATSSTIHIVTYHPLMHHSIHCLSADSRCEERNKAYIDQELSSDIYHQPPARYMGGNTYFFLHLPDLTCPAAVEITSVAFPLPFAFAVSTFVVSSLSFPFPIALPLTLL